MRGGELIKEARRRAGLTQKELAERLGTTQAVIARWEGGDRSPTFERLREAIRACDLDLSVRIVARDDQHELLIEEMLRLSPDERLDKLTEGQAGVNELVRGVRERT
ncbi:MAG: helix-turn-helix domain-containing protein [Actinomycetota bacterium]|jgi:transcriptional regulator with XRE-family HTH domain